MSTAISDESEANRSRRSRAVDTKGVFCANPACADRGVVDRGNVKIHSRKEGRFRCLSCGKTFASSCDTAAERASLVMS